MMVMMIVPNGKLFFFRYPKIWVPYSLIIMCLNIFEHLKTINPPVVTNGK